MRRQHHQPPHTTTTRSNRAPKIFSLPPPLYPRRTADIRQGTGVHSQHLASTTAGCNRRASHRSLRHSLSGTCLGTYTQHDRERRQCALDRKTGKQREDLRFNSENSLCMSRAHPGCDEVPDRCPRLRSVLYTNRPPHAVQSVAVRCQCCTQGKAKRVHARHCAHRRRVQRISFPNAASGPRQAYTYTHIRHHSSASSTLRDASQEVACGPSHYDTCEVHSNLTSKLWRTVREQVSRDRGAPVRHENINTSHFLYSLLLVPVQSRTLAVASCSQDASRSWCRSNCFDTSCEGPLFPTTC